MAIGRMETRSGEQVFRTNPVCFLREVSWRLVSAIKFFLILFAVELLICFALSKFGYVWLWNTQRQSILKGNILPWVAVVVAIAALWAFLGACRKIRTAYLTSTYFRVQSLFRDSGQISFAEYEIEYQETDVKREGKIYSIPGVRTVSGTGEEHIYQLPYLSQNDRDELRGKISRAAEKYEPVSTSGGDVWRQKQIRLDTAALMKREWKWCRKIVVISLILSVAAFIASYFLPGKFSSRMFLLAIAFLIYIPVRIGKTMRDKRRCPETIRFIGDYIYFDEKAFQNSRIERIELSARSERLSKDSDEISRDITVRTGGKTYRYWIGSDESMPEETYQEICREIEKTMKPYRERLIYRKDTDRI